MLEEYIGTECFFVVITQTLHLFVFKDLQIIVMEVMGASFVLFKHQDIVNEEMRHCLQEQMLRGRKKMYACIGQTLCFSLGAAVCHCHGFLEVANYLRDGNN